MKEWAPLKFIFEWKITILAESNLIFRSFTSGRAIVPYPGWLVRDRQEPIYPWYIFCCLASRAADAAKNVYKTTILHI